VLRENLPLLKTTHALRLGILTLFLLGILSLPLVLVWGPLSSVAQNGSGFDAHFVCTTDPAGSPKAPSQDRHNCAQCHFCLSHVVGQLASKVAFSFFLLPAPLQPIERQTAAMAKLYFPPTSRGPPAV